MRIALLILLVPLFVGCKDKSTDSADTADAPTYWDDIAPLYRDNCLTCHQEGGLAPMALDSYAAASEWAEASAGAVAARTMPPWGAEGRSEAGGEAVAEGMTAPGSCDNDYQDDLWLSDEEIARVQAWVDAGKPEGSEQDISVPELPGLSEGLDLTTPEFLPSPVGGGYGEHDEYRCFLFDPALTQDAWLTGYEVYPGNAAIVHHVIGMPIDPTRSVGGGRTNAEIIAEVDGADGRDGWPCYSQAGDDIVVDGEYVTWAPGQGMVSFPEGSGLELNAGDLFAVQIHYNMVDVQGETDATTVRLRLTDSVERPGQIILMDGWNVSSLPAGDPAATVQWQLGRAAILDYTGFDSAVIEGVLPHMHQYGVQQVMEVGPSDDRACVTGVRQWDFAWQRVYFYEEPVSVEAGEAIQVTCTYDLTEASGSVTWGWGTEDEMCLVGLFITGG
jgi:mono/diheme cytochrome c family protein